jgi:hypothetical protein
MTTIIARWQAGKWSEVDSPAFPLNSKRMRQPNCSLIGRSEATDQSTDKTLRLNGRAWDFYHPTWHGRPADCSLEWRKLWWTPLDRGLKQLTDFRAHTKKGTLLLPSMATWILLEAQFQKNLLLLFSAAHNNLDNTPDRAGAWKDEAHTFRTWHPEFVQQIKQAHPHHKVISLHQADVNKNLKEPYERHQVHHLMLEGTGLTWGWDVDHLPAQGDEGKQIISYAFSNVPHTSTVMSGDKFSDHDPVQTRIPLA